MNVPNDDMRGFLEKTVGSYSTRKPLIYANSNHDLSLWVRVGSGSITSSIPFIEFYISDVLRQNNFFYQTGDAVSTDLVERARQILQNSHIAEKAKILIQTTNKRLVNIANDLSPEEEYQKIVGKAV